MIAFLTSFVAAVVVANTWIIITITRKERKGGYRAHSQGDHGRTDREPSPTPATLPVAAIRGAHAKFAAGDAPARAGDATGLGAPDLIEPIIGYRAWQVLNGPVSAVLVPINGSEKPWPTGRPLRALCRDSKKCLHTDPTTGKRVGTTPPNIDHTCGIYAASQYDGMMVPTSGITAWGEVALWGRVVEHERGYRAELAYPARLTICGPGATEEVAKRLAAAYNVPCELGTTDDLRERMYGKATQYPSGFQHHAAAARGISSSAHPAWSGLTMSPPPKPPPSHFKGGASPPASPAPGSLWTSHTGTLYSYQGGQWQIISQSGPSAAMVQAVNPACAFLYVARTGFYSTLPPGTPIQTTVMNLAPGTTTTATVTLSEFGDFWRGQGFPGPEPKLVDGDTVTVHAPGNATAVAIIQIIAQKALKTPMPKLGDYTKMADYYDAMRAWKKKRKMEVMRENAHPGPSGGTTSDP